MNASGCEGLLDYLRDDDEGLWFKLRSSLDWDEASYRRMVQALVDCLEATEDAEQVPRALARMFVFYVPGILGMMSRPDFLQFNAGELDPEEARAHFAPRMQLLEDLSLWFSQGTRPFGDERLSVGDWSPTFRRRNPGG